MQDNQSYDTKKLAERGWSQMETKLDRHMPVGGRNKKRILWYWFAAAAVIIAAIFITDQRSSETQDLAAPLTTTTPITSARTQDLVSAAATPSSSSTDVRTQNFVSYVAQPSTSRIDVKTQDHVSAASRPSSPRSTPSSPLTTTTPITSARTQDLVSAAATPSSSSTDVRTQDPVSAASTPSSSSTDVRTQNFVSNEAQPSTSLIDGKTQDPVSSVAQPSTSRIDGRTQDLMSAASTPSSPRSTPSSPLTTTTPSTSVRTQDLVSAVLPKSSSGKTQDLMPDASFLSEESISISTIPTLDLSPQYELKAQEELSAISMPSKRMHLPLAMQLNALYNLQSLSPGLAIGLESNVWQYAKRWSLVAGLSAEYSSLEQSFFTDIQSGKTKVESNTVQFDFAGAGEVSSSSLRDLWAVRASLGTSYSITPRFSVTAAIQPGLLFSHTRVERLYTSLPQEGFNQANNLTRKWDILGSLSMNYRFSKHFGMNTGFRYGITPYIGGITNSGPGRSQQLLLGMNYFFN